MLSSIFGGVIGVFAPRLVRNAESKAQIQGDKMTNEQKLLSYLYTIDSIQRRQLVIALSDMPYQSLTLAVRNAVKHGYVEVFRKDESNHIVSHRTVSSISVRWQKTPSIVRNEPI